MLLHNSFQILLKFHLLNTTIFLLLKQLETVGESLNAFEKISSILNNGIEGKDSYLKAVNDLKEATKNCSTEALKMALSQEELWQGTNKLDKELVKEILSQHILDKELLETTSAEIANAGATKVNEAAKKSATKETIKYKYAVQGLGDSLKNIGSSALGLIKAHPIIAAITAITAVVGTAIISAKQYQEEQKELIENANALQEEYRNVTKTLSDNISSLESQKADFSKLAKGVDEFGNNISLSADEYDRYKSIVSEVLGYTPELISGYDAEGNAIANKNSLIERSIELMKEEQRQKLKEMTTDEKTGTAYDAATASWNQTKSYDIDARNKITSFARLKGDWEFLNPLGLYDEFTDYKANASSANQNITSFIHDNYELVINAIKENKQALYDAQDNHGKSIFTSDEVDDLVDWANDWQKAYSDWQEEIEDAKHGMDDQFELYAQRADGYDDLTDAQKAFVNEYIKATGDIIDADGNLLSEDEILKKAKSYEKFVDKLASDPNFKVARDNINKLFALNSEVSAGEYEKQVDAILADLQKQFDLTDDEVKDFKISLGFEFTSEGTTRTSELIQMVQDKLSDEFDGKALELSLDDLVIASNLEVSPGTLLSWEKLIELINEAKGNANKTEISKSREEMISTINGLSEGFEELGKIYNSIKNKNPFDFKLLDDEKFKENFSDLETYADFIETISENNDDINACQEAFNSLVTEWINGKGVLKGLTEENRNIAIQMLKQMGVTNAEAVVLEHEKNSQLLDDYEEYIKAKNWDDTEYLENLSEDEAKLINNLKDTYSTDYDNWIELLKKKSDAYNNFVTAISSSIPATSVIDENRTAQSIIENYEKYGAKKIASITMPSYMQQGIYNPNNSLAKYTTAEYEAAKQLVELNKQTQAMKNSLSFNLSTISPTFSKFEGVDASSSSKSQNSDTYFDHIETRLDNLNDALDETKEKANNTLNGWSERSNAYNQSLAQILSLKAEQEKARARYLEEANKSGLSNDYKKLVQQGAIDITKLSNDDPLKEKIDSYQKWYEKVKECDDAIKQLDEDYIKWTNDSRNFRWEAFDYLEDSISRITEEANDCILVNDVTPKSKK